MKYLFSDIYYIIIVKNVLYAKVLCYKIKYKLTFSFMIILSGIDVQPVCNINPTNISYKWEVCENIWIDVYYSFTQKPLN